MKKGFTLVELLVVVAILGILAAVGIVSFGGFLGSAKVNATKANHKNIVNFMSAKITQCSLQEKIDLVDEHGTPTKIQCSNLQENDFVKHFRGSGFKNPYGTSVAVNNDRGCNNTLGITDIRQFNYKLPFENFEVNTYYKEGEDCLFAIIIVE